MKKDEKTSIQNQEVKKDSVNLENVKINVKDAKNELRTKESSAYSKKEIYLSLDGLNEMEQKKKRSFLRRKALRFVSDILGKDRKEIEIEKSVKEFILFYKENWKITDFKIENFSSSKKESNLKDFTNLLEFVKSTLK